MPPTTERQKYNTKNTDPLRRLFELLCELRDDTANLMMTQRTYSEDPECLDRIAGLLETLREKARSAVYLVEVVKERRP